MSEIKKFGVIGIFTGIIFSLINIFEFSFYGLGWKLFLEKIILLSLVWFILFFVFGIVYNYFKNKKGFVSVVLGILFLLILGYRYNKDLFKVLWLSKVDVFGISIAAGFFNGKVLAFNFGLLLAALIFMIVLYKLRKLKRSYIYYAVFAGLAELARYNSILMGDVSFGFLFRKIIVFLFIILGIGIFYKDALEYLSKKFYKVFAVFLILVLIVSGAVYFDDTERNYKLFNSSFETGIIFENVKEYLGFEKIKFNLKESDKIKIDSVDGEKFNIIYILVDTLRADHLGSYGYGREISKNIDKVAEEGIVFKNVYAASSWTPTSLTSIFTSLYPSKHGVYEIRGNVLDDKFTTLAEILKENNYKTGAFVADDIRVISFYNGLKQGFDDFYSYEVIDDDYLKGEYLNKKVIDWLDKNKNERFFAFVHYDDAHFPYDPSEYYDIFSNDKGVMVRNSLMIDKESLQYMKDKYDGSIYYADDKIGELIYYLEKNNLIENTIIVIGSDHGEEFMEHKGLTHSRTLYNEVVKIPLIIKIPNGENKIINERISGVDIMPIILESVGIKIGGVDGDSELADKEIFGEIENKMFGDEHGVYYIIKDDYKFIFNKQDRSEELYNLEKDFSEKENLIFKEAESAEELRRELFEWKRS